ncbi:MAG: hypothetical protein JOZ32_20565 [Bryobacterales bacterium]|nr:hypothetical protein [Bryobacterales bacterium]
MSARNLLRIVLSVVVLALLWLRIARQWRYESVWWLMAGVMLSAFLLLLVVVSVRSAFGKPRPPRDDVPKRPLGLDS